MAELYSYRDDQIYCHHSLDPTPDSTDFSMHIHDRMEVLAVLSGAGHFLVEGSDYPLHGGDVLVLRPLETHRLLIRPEEPYERVAIHFDPALIEAVEPRLLSPFRDRPLGSGNLYAGTAYPALYRPFADFDFSRSELPRANILARLLSFLTELADAAPRTPCLPPPDEAGRLVGYVNERLFESLSLADLGRRFRKSEAQIARDFRRATGSTFGDYVRIKRLLAAQGMLLQGIPASRVCLQCGYGDYSAFFRAYKAYFGTSPTRRSAR